MTAAQAYRKVHAALKQGRLVRATSCTRCGAPDRKGSDGRSTIHAHHADYNRPLDVEWICAKCHRSEIPLAVNMGASTSGSRNGRAKLTEKTVAMIRSSDETISVLARRLRASHSAVYRARRGITWLAADEADS